MAAVAAETAEIAADAIRAIKVEYQVLRYVVRAEDALKEGAPKVFPEGNIEAKDSGRPAKIEERGKKGRDYRRRVPDSNPSSFLAGDPWQHGGLSRGDTAIVYASTQGTFTIPADAAKELGLPEIDYVAIVEHMGGGFGSKFGIGIEGASPVD